MATRNFSTAVTQASGATGKGVSGVSTPTLVGYTIDVDTDKDLAGNVVATTDDAVLFPVPDGTAVTRVYVEVIRASDAATSATGVLKTGAGNIATAIDLKSAAGTTLAPTPTVQIGTASNNSFIFTPTYTGTTTIKGKFRIVAELIPISAP